MPPAGPPYRREGLVILIELRLNRLQQLFETLDPAPFHAKDLDADAESYIVGAAREFPVAIPLKIVIHLPASELAAIERDGVGQAIRNYFAYRLETTRRDLRQILRQGRLSLIIAVVFLAACMSLRELVLSFGDGTANKMLAEGLLISGWVAMWRPIQLFLYDWWPIRQTGAIYAKLSNIAVEIKAEG